MRFIEKLNYDWMDMLNFFERPFRAKFIPSKVWNDLDRYKNDKVGLSNYFRKWKTKVEWKKELSKAKFYEKYVAVGGEYDPENRQCIIIIHTDKYDTFQFSDKAWDRFKFKLIQTQMHELIHFMQYDKRHDEWSNYVVPYKKVGHERKDAERRYLSEFDEIQAYAHCALLEFKQYKPNVSLSKLMSRSSVRRDSPTLCYFLSAFDFDYTNNEAIPKIMHQIMKWNRKYDKLYK